MPAIFSRRLIWFQLASGALGACLEPAKYMKRHAIGTLLGCLIAAAGIWMANPAAAAEKHELAAAICYSIAKFAEWPLEPGKDGNIYLGVYSEGEPARAFASLDGHPLKGKELRVAGVDRTTNQMEIQRCSILFTATAKDLKHALDVTRGGPTLVIHLRGKEEKISYEPCVELFESRNKLGFDAYLSPLKQRNIQLNSSVLKLAANVHRG